MAARRALWMLVLPTGLACTLAWAPAAWTEPAAPGSTVPPPGTAPASGPADGDGTAVLAPETGPTAVALSHGAPLVIYNRTVATFRVPLYGVSPAERAQAAGERIWQLIRRGGPGEVSLETAPQGVVVKLDGTLAFAIVKGDEDRIAGESVEQAARRAARAFTQVVTEIRESRSPRELAVAGITVLLATGLWWGALYGLRRAERAFRSRLLLATQKRAARLRAFGVVLLDYRGAYRLARSLLQTGYWTVTLLLIYSWLTFVLRQLPFVRPWGEGLRGFLLDVLREIVLAVLGAIPGLLVVAIIFLLARGLVILVHGLLDRVEAGRIEVGWLNEYTIRPTRRIASVVIWLFALAAAYLSLPGAQTQAFQGLSVLVGLMVSIGASGIVGQAASGLILMYGRAFKAGEHMRIGEHEGQVVDLGTVATRIRTGTGEELVLPNLVVLGSVTRNFSRGVAAGGYIVGTTVTIGYATPWRQVHGMLIEAARRTAGIGAHPPPRVVQTALSDFYVEYRLVCLAATAESRAEMLNRLHANVQDVFNDYGVQIMSPHYRADPSAPQVVPRERWHEPPAAVFDAGPDGASAGSEPGGKASEPPPAPSAPTAA